MVGYRIVNDHNNNILHLCSPIGTNSILHANERSNTPTEMHRCMAATSEAQQRRVVVSGRYYRVVIFDNVYVFSWTLLDIYDTQVRRQYRVNIDRLHTQSSVLTSTAFSIKMLMIVNSRVRGLNTA